MRCTCFYFKHGYVPALRHVHRAAGERMLTVIEGMTPDAGLRAVVEESLPLDEERRRLRPDFASPCHRQALALFLVFLSRFEA